MGDGLSALGRARQYVGDRDMSIVIVYTGLRLISVMGEFICCLFVIEDFGAG